MRPGAFSSRRRTLLTALVGAALLGSALIPAAALAGTFTPESGGSPNADAIHTLYVITLIIATVILLIVEVALIWCLRRYKAGKGKVAAQIHGNTNLEIGWTVGAAVILVILSIVTFAMLGKIDNPRGVGPRGLQDLSGSTQLVASNSTVPKPPGGKALRICVTGRQYIWRYTYARCSANGLGKVYSYEEMVVPVDTPVVLDIQSTDVNHSWWIPKLGGKFDAIPGYHNYTWFKASHTGIFKGQCAELCGRNHADMTAQVRVVPAQQYTQWISDQKQQINEANKGAERQRKQLQSEGQL